MIRSLFLTLTQLRKHNLFFVFHFDFYFSLLICIEFKKKTHNQRMSTTSENAFESSMSPFVNEYQAITEGLVSRQENLKSEFASLSESI